MSTPLPPSSQRRVLIIDDEPLMLSFMGYALKEYGYQVLAFRSAGEAFRQLEGATEQPHIVLVDVGNGRKDFLAVKERLPRLPCILMVSDLALGEEKQLRELGADHILQKPFSLAKVLEVLKSVKLPGEDADEPFTVQ